VTLLHERGVTRGIDDEAIGAALDEDGRRVKCEGPHGNIVGGHVTAAETVTATTIGSRIGVTTHVTAGVAVAGTRAIYAGVRLVVHGAKHEVLDTENVAYFVEKDGTVVRSGS
jgi:hypothetical protein